MKKPHPPTPRPADRRGRRAATAGKGEGPGAVDRPLAAAGGERIQKVLASAGVASRRAIEDWIREGRVTVNGSPATIGQKIGSRDRLAVDGRPLKLPRQVEPRRVLLYKKRVGEVVTRSDPDGRRTVFRKLPELASGRWIAVGRLDVNTSGLLLLTNDGELARRLMHPSYEVRREYAVRVLGDIEAETLARLRRGVHLDDGTARFDTLEAADGRDYEDEGSSANRWFRVSLHEGRQRVVRRLFESQGLQVSRLIRVAYGPVKLGGGIKSGSYRELDRDETAALLKAVDMPTGR
jgi:23S rRNA pseudouridine2605 synthase